MTTPSVLGNLATFGYNTASSGSFTSVTNVKAINVPSPEFNIVNVSGLLDTIDVKTIGFLDNKNFSVEMFHNAANFALVTATWPALTSPAYYQITLSDSTSFTMQAWFKGYKAKADRNAAVVYTADFEITGAVSYS